MLMALSWNRVPTATLLFGAKLLISGNKTDEIKIATYSVYLEFLSSLYEFYIAFKEDNNITRDELITQEVKKLIVFLRCNDIEPPQNNDFAKQFREIRNFKYHTSKSISSCPSVAKFYRSYHKYIMILMQPPLFSWNHPAELWEDINLFVKEISITNNNIGEKKIKK
jgi:predicted transport protein